MGSVISRSRFSRELKIKFGIFMTYFLATLAFFYFGFKPATSPEDVYAKEAKEATSYLSLSSENTTEKEPLPVKTIAKIGKDLEVPEQIVGAYSINRNKTLLIGHSSTAFKNLKDLKLGNSITYSEKQYTITNIEEKLKDNVSMKEVLKSEEIDTIILMTCTGDKIEGTTDYTHRLIITASLV